MEVFPLPCLPEGTTIRSKPIGKPPNTCEPTLDHAGLTYCFLADVQSSLYRADFQYFPTKKRLSSGLEPFGAVWSPAEMSEISTLHRPTRPQPMLLKRRRIKGT